MQANNFRPDSIVIDLSMGRSEGLQIAKNLRLNPQHEKALIVALASEDEGALESLTAIRRAGADLIITYYAKEAARWLEEGE